ncbi:MAG: hypothetical protein RLZZ28_1810 [Bacteroidota bacterium]|jgi:hypothetical protein
MKKVLAAGITIIALMVSCKTPQQSTGVWINKEKITGKKFSNIFILVMSADLEARSMLENDLAKIAGEKGYKTVKSIDVMAPTLQDSKLPSKETIVAKVKESGCDAVFIASLLKKDESVRYTPGQEAYSVQPYYTWSGNYIGYYSHWQPTVSTASYYTQEKAYFMQSNLYETASQEIMWSVQSQVFDPKNIGKFSKSYTSTLVGQLSQEGLLKKAQ